MTEQEKLLSLFLSDWEKGADIEAQTSGSTGEPKKIFLPRKQVERSARRTNNFFHISSSSHVHSAVSFRFIGGKMMIARSLVAGCRLSFSEPALNPEPPSSHESIDLMAVVPAQMVHILENRQSFSHVSNFIIGGSAINNSLWTRLAASGLNCWETYGMTETASHIALRKIEGKADQRPGFIPMEDISLNVNEDDCLCIWDGDVYVATNDIARILPDGSFHILGRRDDVIITGGIKVMPQEVEAVLRPFLAPIVADFFISETPDEVWTSRLVLKAVVPDSANSEEVRNGIKTALDSVPSDLLPKRLRPKDVVLISKLPLTASGKLNRRPL